MWFWLGFSQIAEIYCCHTIVGCYTPLYILVTNNATLRIVTVTKFCFTIWYYGYIHTRFMNAKEMTGKEKLVFIASFMWAMHWGVRVAFAAISTFELRYF